MPGKVRFGVFEFDVTIGELSKGGTPIRLQEQPCRILACLIEHSGEIVTRQQLRELIWGKDIFVDFDQSLNKAVNRLREALNDDAGQPRYIETIPRRGYRFVAPISGPAPLQPPVIHPPAPQWLGFPGLAVVGCGIAAACVILAVALPPKLRTPSPVRITTDGSATQPAFSKDGELLVALDHEVLYPVSHETSPIVPPERLRIVTSISVPSTNAVWLPEISGLPMVKELPFEAAITKQLPRPASMATAGP